MTAGARPSPSPHPDLDTLADLDAGVLEGADAERVTAHVAGCARCAQAMAALDGVRADLAALPAPPMPAAVAARLDATLADLRTAPPPGRPVAAVAAAPAPVADLDAARARRRRRLRAVSSGAAAAVVLVAAGASVVSLTRSAGGGSDSSAAGAGSAEQQTTRDQQDSAGAAPAPAASLPSLPSFDRTTLRAALPSLAAANPVNRAAGGGTAGPLGPAGVMADTARRTACQGTIAGAEGVLSAVRWIRYDGRPAYVFVFEDASRRTAYVVDEQCGGTPAVPATVLATVR